MNKVLIQRIAMKRVAILISVLLTVSSYSNEDNITLLAKLDNPTSMIVFCQESQDVPLRTVNYVYDQNDNLIAETSTRNGESPSEIRFEYNTDNQITLEVHLTDHRKTESTYVYNEANQLVNILYKLTDYDTDGQITAETEMEAPREYINDQLVKEWEYWGGFSTYEYKDGKVVTKIDHTKNGGKHHFTYYKYSGNLLTEEKKETRLGGLMYLKTYHYDSQNRLTQIRDQENVVEESDYNGNRLIEKREYYFGIDPGYFPCQGNYVYRYEY